MPLSSCTFWDRRPLRANDATQFLRFQKKKSGKNADTSTKEDARMVRDWEQEARRLRPHDVDLKKTPEQLAYDKNMAETYAKRNLEKDKALQKQYNAFLDCKLRALNELPPDLREKAMIEDQTPPPVTGPYRFLYTVTPPDPNTEHLRVAAREYREKMYQQLKAASEQQKAEARKEKEAKLARKQRKKVQDMPEEFIPESVRDGTARTVTI